MIYIYIYYIFELNQLEIHFIEILSAQRSFHDHVIAYFSQHTNQYNSIEIIYSYIIYYVL